MSEVTGVHICSSRATGKNGHRVCGMCYMASGNCRCYLTQGGTVMFGFGQGPKRWSAWYGDDLIDRIYLGSYKTKDEARAAVRAAASVVPSIEQMSDRDLYVLDLIASFVEANDYAISVRELGVAIDLSSPQTVQKIIDRLRNGGFVEVSHQSSRTLRLTRLGHFALRIAG